MERRPYRRGIFRVSGRSVIAPYQAQERTGDGQRGNHSKSNDYVPTPFRGAARCRHGWDGKTRSRIVGKKLAQSL